MSLKSPVETGGFHFALPHSSYNNRPQRPLLTESNNAFNVHRQMFNLHMWFHPALPDSTRAPQHAQKNKMVYTNLIIKYIYVRLKVT